MDNIGSCLARILTSATVPNKIIPINLWFDQSCRYFVYIQYINMSWVETCEALALSEILKMLTFLTFESFWSRPLYCSDQSKHNSQFLQKNNKHKHKIFCLIGRDWYWVLITKMHHPQCFVGCIEGKVGCWCSKAINSQLFGLVASKHFPGVQILTKSHSRPMCCHRIFSHKTFGTGTSAKAHTDFHDSGFLFS